MVIGTGHVRRMITLAGQLQDRGWQPLFISLPLAGHVLDNVKQHGFDVVELELAPPDKHRHIASPVHAHWLPHCWKEDALQVQAILSQRNIDTVCVDHYALDWRWEEAIGLDPHHIVVVDDLADRRHHCGLLVDGNLGRNAKDYKGLVPETAQTACGPHYALLRPEFAAQRQQSKLRRNAGKLESILVALGGVDNDNVTGVVLDALENMKLPSTTRLDIVMGGQSPSLPIIRARLAHQRVSARLYVDTTAMAALMAAADLAIGGAGVTAWERCALGLPSLLVILAENQRSGANALSHAGAARLVGEPHEIPQALAQHIENLQDPALMKSMTEAALRVTDGLGAFRIAELIETLYV